MFALFGSILLVVLAVALAPLGRRVGGPIAAAWICVREGFVHRLGPARQQRQGFEIVNLPGRLLAARRRLFRVEGSDGDHRAPRVYLIPAKHAGAATMKARNWGMKIRQVTDLEKT